MLKEAGFEIRLSDKKYSEIKKYISKTANRIADKIKSEVNGRHISLMLDVATKNHKSILGINIRYIIDREIKERCIGMIPLYERHTAANLAIETKKCVNKFQIDLRQIKSITTDNAGNAIGIIDHLEETIYSTEEDEEVTLNSSSELCAKNSNINAPVSENEIYSLARQFIEEEALAAILDDTEEYEELLKQVVNGLPHHVKGNMFGVRCGNHTVNLIVRGAIKKSNMHELVTLCRKIAVLLREDAFVREARHNHLEYILPRLNVVTRWDSDYLMVIVF